LAAHLGAREMLLGDITPGNGNNVVMRASLIPTAGGTGKDAVVEGSRDSISSLVDQLAVRLLALRVGQDIRALGELAGTPSSAIRDYLEGEALLRNGSYEQSFARFTTAVQGDSNFAVAWVGLRDAAGWLAKRAMVDSTNAHIVRLREKLTPATRAPSPRMNERCHSIRVLRRPSSICPTCTTSRATPRLCGGRSTSGSLATARR